MVIRRIKGEYKMKIKSIESIKTEAEARQYAIDYQSWASRESLSYNELAEWQYYFETLSKKFNLKTEFKENGII